MLHLVLTTNLPKLSHNIWNGNIKNYGVAGVTITKMKAIGTHLHLTCLRVGCWNAEKGRVPSLRCKSVHRQRFCEVTMYTTLIR